MIKIRVADNQIEIYSGSKMIELVQGQLSRFQKNQIVADWFYGKTMQVEVMNSCTWYYQNVELEDTEFEYAKGGII